MGSVSFTVARRLAVTLVVGLVVDLAVVRAAEPGPLPAIADEVTAAETGSEADRPTDPLGSGIDVWVASTRRLPGACHVPEQPAFAVERLVDDGCRRRWEPADLGGLLADTDRPLVFFVHGNRYEAADAKSQGLALAERLAALRAAHPRVVILSWPSQQQGILLKDGRRKYERAPTDGRYFAWLLGQVVPEQPVAIVGYSLGALVATEALDQLAAGAAGPAGGLRWADRPGRTHLVFVTPAVRADALAPRGPYRRTFDGVDRITLLINSRDEALKFFPLLDEDVRAPALGFVGMPRRWVPAGVEYTAVDATRIVGKMHTLARYLDSRSLSERIAGGTLDALAAE